MKRIGVIWLSIMLVLSALLVIPAGEDVKGDFDGEPSVVNIPDTSISSTQALDHHWKLDETSGDTAYDSEGEDHGTIVGATINQTGMIGTSYWFDGSDDYVEFDDNDTLDFPLGKDFGIFAWINTTSINCRFLSKREVPGDATGYVMMIQSGKFGVYLDFGATGVYLEGMDSISDGQWHRVGMVRTGNTLEAFIDGGSIGTNDNAGGDLSNGNPLLLGVEQGLSLDYTGYIDDVIIGDIPPIANAGQNKFVPPTTLVYFDGSASFDDIGITDYWWNFTDAGPQSLTGVNPSYVFNNIGIYTVTLIVMDTIGQLGSDIMEVNVRGDAIFLDFHTDLDIPDHGTVTGTHDLTHVLDGSTQEIKEIGISTKSAPGATPLSPGPGPQPGAQVYYTDRPTFDLETGPLQFFEDFEDASDNVTFHGPGAIDVPLDENSNNEYFQPGDIEPGIRFWDNPPDGLVVDGPPFPPSVTVFDNTFLDSMDIDFFNNDTWAVGMDILTFIGEVTVDISIYGVGGVLLDTTTAPGTNAGTFWGVISDELITRINLEDPTGNSVECGDNIAFGEPGRYSLAHAWRIEVLDPGATNMMLFVNARTNTGADDNFIFEYSEDGIVWDSTGILVDTDVMTEYIFTLPNSINGPIWLRVKDTVHDAVQQDTLYVDHIRVDWFGFPPFEIQLNEGWNLISLPLEQSDESIDQVLSSIDGKWDCIQIYESLSPEPWKTNNKYRPDQLNDFSTLNHKQGFWINITESNVNLTVSGIIPAFNTIPLYAGWNLVGYPSLTNERVANALWGTGANKVEAFDPAEPYRIREIGPTYLMKPGEGYWVHVPADTIWIINW